MERGESSDRTKAEMTDTICILNDTPILKIDNARMLFIDLEPNQYALIFSLPHYQGDLIRVYTDEHIINFKKIGSIKVKNKKREDY